MLLFTQVEHCYVAKVSNNVSVEIETDVLLNINFNLIIFSLQQSCPSNKNREVCVSPVITIIVIALCKSASRG